MSVSRLAQQRPLSPQGEAFAATCCHTLPMWERLDKMVDEFFEGITLADLLAEQKQN